MYILSVDTTAKTAAVSVCKYDNDIVSVKSTCAFNGTLTHSETLLPMIDFCLDGADVVFDDVSLCAVSAGPGSFTGVRIGISTLKGLAFGRKIPCVPVSALHALALNVDFEKRGTVVCACMDARRNQFYNALFSADGKGNLKRLCEDRAISAEDLYTELCNKYGAKNIVLVGDGAQLAYKLMHENNDCPLKLSLARQDLLLQNGYSVAKAAIMEYNSSGNKQEFDANVLLPSYLRLPQAERERNERLKV